MAIFTSRKDKIYEKKPLLSLNNQQIFNSFRWRDALFRLLFILVCLVGLYFVISLIFNNSEKNETPIRLTSIATINNDYFKQCAPKVICDPDAKYRTINGSCNNLQNPSWGAALTPFYRYLDPQFSDGVSKFRVQSDGTPLPNARNITLTFFQNSVHYCDQSNNELLIPWGQFVTHDFAYSPVDSINSSFPAGLQHCDANKPTKECDAVIYLSPNDPTYEKYNITYLKFMRLITSKNYSCPLVPDTVLNQNTHYIDASNVYGSDSKLAKELRSFKGGQLKFNQIGNEKYCPQDPSKIVKNGSKSQVTIAFLAGDTNVNQNLGIALFQNLFLRFHNNIAHELQIKHPMWSDEVVYQETRRIVAAVVQVITYDHYLPILLGEKYMEKYGLTSETKYDPTLIVSVAQEMTSGAFRLLHNIIPAQLNFMSNNDTIYDVEEPSKTILRPDSLIGNYDGLLRGLLKTPGRPPQSSYNKLISNIVIEVPHNKSATSGFDLLSYDIQRGRDTGLPPYNSIRAFCGLPKANSFDDLSDEIELPEIDKLKMFYATVDDIDFFVGILLEAKMNGSFVGPTAGCIIADSFYRYRNGDRYFYDVQGQPGSFTTDQINSLKNITLSHLICTTSHLEHVHKNAFRFLDQIQEAKLNLNCEAFKIDLTPW